MEYTKEMIEKQNRIKQTGVYCSQYKHGQINVKPHAMV
jgi:hypothetical protein